ncbi:hypothetical protein PACTADRAFT_83146 [Pachysolen tannophilus NRRL Y-2460]|uniref:Hap4 transcription factor heteromerisation domain-containing protein n=1 Tax=Pachysolen tannophilus NRRL Y-2460 TaxID=669874 RepID=A0A1E4U110_PACTA|nr:hypothetical protein PACTADRAFT_83146 [Pachysolen tannophilus NRRL Y-2460]
MSTADHITNNNIDKLHNNSNKCHHTANGRPIHNILHGTTTGTTNYRIQKFPHPILKRPVTNHSQDPMSISRKPPSCNNLQVSAGASALASRNTTSHNGGTRAHAHIAHAAHTANISPAAAVSAALALSEKKQMNQKDSNDSSSITIKTSKKWVLPPRPKPGRKPLLGAHSSSSTSPSPLSSASALSASPAVSSPVLSANTNTNTNKSKAQKQTQKQKQAQAQTQSQNAESSTGTGYAEQAKRNIVKQENVPIAPAPAPIHTHTHTSTSTPTPTSNSTLASASASVSASVSDKNMSRSISSSKSPVKVPIPSYSPAAETQRVQPQKNQSPAPLIADTVKSKITTVKPKATCGAKRGRKPSSAKNKAIQEAVKSNPLKQAILKVNEENYYLKLEVIKLVSDLKSLKNEVQEQQRQKSQGLEGSPGDDINMTITNPQNQVLDSVPMVGKSSSNLTENNMTIYKLHESNDGSVEKGKQQQQQPQESQESQQLQEQNLQEVRKSRKRVHDEDINDLIVSLIDLNHSQKLQKNELKNQEIQPVSPFTKTPIDQNQMGEEVLIDQAQNLNASLQKNVETVENFNNASKRAKETFKQPFTRNIQESTPMTIDGTFENIASSPNDFEHAHIRDDDSAEIESLTPNSLLSLSKTNSTIEDLELGESYHYGHLHESLLGNGDDNKNRFNNLKLLDIPELVKFDLDNAAQGEQQQEQANLQKQPNGVNEGVNNFDSDFTFWKDDLLGAAGSTSSSKIKNNLVFNTTSTLDELIMKRQKEREEELLRYDDQINDFLDFNNNNDSNDFLINDDWTLDEFDTESTFLI